MQIGGDKAIVGGFLAEETEFRGVGKVYYRQRAVVDGITSASLSPQLELDKNTIVRKLDLIVTAQRATHTAAEQVAQLRAYSTGGEHNLVIDFGTPRTVSEIEVPETTNILNVSAWIGAQFDFPFYPKGYGATGSSPVAAFPSEVRTERLLVSLSGGLSEETLGTDVTLELPDPPADLDIRINGGQPVWTSAGPVQPTDTETATTDHWNKNFARIVPLAEALNALLADPLGEGKLKLDVALGSKVPGKLSVKVNGAPELSHIHRIKFGAETSTDLEFTEEGQRNVDLPLPATGAPSIEAVRFTMLGTLPPERVLPPLGPNWAPAPPDAESLVLAELVLDSARAAAVRLGDAGLAELTGVRLPLIAPSDGAEVRIALWTPDPVTHEPLEVMANAVSDPVTLAGAETPDAWTTFAFPKPVSLEKIEPPWAVVLVTRGSLTWSLARKPTVTGADGSDSALAEANVLRRGAPNGPWRVLPAPFQSSAAPAVMDARGRIRSVGHGSKTTPVAPLIVSLAGAASQVVDVTPTAKGVPVTIAFDPPVEVPAPNPTLTIVSRAVGTVTLRDVDVTWREA